MIWHRAFTFDPAEMHARLASSLEQRGGFDREALIGYATEVWETAEGDAAEYLNAIRMWPGDEDIRHEILGASEGELHATWFYDICFAPSMRPCPAIKPFLIVRHCLESLGWSPREAARLITGDRLDGLMQGCDDARLKALLVGDADPAALRAFVGQFGGWIAASDLGPFREKVGEAVERIRNTPRDAPAAWVRKFFPHTIDADQVVSHIDPGFDQALAMLDEAFQRGVALRLVIED